jgi:predicted nucleic acid-binding protein
MNFLLDTCIISEPKQKRPSERVLEWLDAQDESKIYLSVLTVGEIKKESQDSNRAKRKRNSNDG